MNMSQPRKLSSAQSWADTIESSELKLEKGLKQIGNDVDSKPLETSFGDLSQNDILPLWPAIRGARAVFHYFAQNVSQRFSQTVRICVPGISLVSHCLRNPAMEASRATSPPCIQIFFTVYLYIWHTDSVSRPVLSPETELASTLALDIRTVSSKLKQHLRAHGAHDELTPSQVSVVLRLEKDGAATVSNLARAEGMRPQSMSAVITPLQDAGLVDSAPDPNDGRQTLMGLTPKCLKLLKERRAAKQDWLTRRILQKLSGGEQKKLQAALGLLMRLVED